MPLDFLACLALELFGLLIGGYAPPNENNSVGYINRVAKDIGVSVNEPINVSSKPVAIALATVIVGVELGYQPYNPKVFEDAWLLL
ncbi:hypothetical protein JEP40_06445 [Proteus vulgaris]|uniref:hypothetical protein n=1 Tax=Proteus vulgaris TaxID=585 RepID=UPI0018E437DC|nr:hypothetical protein [Proteus vulgaris]MBI6528763.1 hypothetical protein [Proteus vulgaris]